MSNELKVDTEKEKTDQLKESIRKDSVQIGKFKFLINRKVTFTQLESFTNEAFMLEESSRNQRADTLMETAKRSDKWVRQIFENFLVDFNSESLKNILPLEANNLSAQIFFSVRTGLPFLALTSPDSLKLEEAIN